MNERGLGPCTAHEREAEGHPRRGTGAEGEGEHWVACVDVNVSGNVSVDGNVDVDVDEVVGRGGRGGRGGEWDGMGGWSGEMGR